MMRWTALAAGLTALLSGGCFSERSFPMSVGELVPLGDEARVVPATTRQWLHVAHQKLELLLPTHACGALLTEDLVRGDGRARNVAAHFLLVPKLLSFLPYNLPGIMYSAQATGGRFESASAPPWPGFEDVWIPIDEKLQLAGRLGLAQRDGQVLRSVCIVLIPGLFGDNWTTRSRDLGLALRDAGFHVLSLDQRGHGQTELRYPAATYTYGVYEAGDLLTVAQWLQERPEVSDTGLVGFCWGANEALLAAWEDGRAADDPDVSETLRGKLRPRGGDCYRAGIIAFSPPVRFEELLDDLDSRLPALLDPILAALAGIVDGRALQKGYGDVNGSLRTLTLAEARRAEPKERRFAEDGLQYLRLLPFRDRKVSAKLDAARVPVLIVHAANDPISRAQPIADLVATTDNPRVAAIVLPDGGHCGFAPYARGYFYSLVLNFFDRDRGAAACTRRTLALTLSPHE